MIGHSADRDVPPVNADDAFDDPDVDLALVEDRALLDVQLDEGLEVARLAARLRESLWITADCPYALADRLAAVTHDIERRRVELADHRETSDEPAFLIGET